MLYKQSCVKCAFLVKDSFETESCVDGFLLHTFQKLVSNIKDDAYYSWYLESQWTGK